MSNTESIHSVDSSANASENAINPLNTSTLPYKENGDSIGEELTHIATNSVADIGPADVSDVESVQRISRSLTNAESIEERTRKLTTPLPLMGGGRGYPPSLPDKEMYIVSFEGADDPMHPFNWPFKKKSIAFVCLTLVVVAVAFGSSVFSTGTAQMEKEFHVSQEVITLGTALYVLGFAMGPLAWAPISELYGRKPVILVSSFVFCCFQFAIATAKDLQTIMICRFVGSCMGSAPLVVVGAAFADMFDNKSRGYAIVLFSMGVIVGPMLAPIIGGFVSNSYLGWRWTEYLTGILASFSMVLAVLFYQESHHPIILSQKAEELRRRTGIWGIRSAHEEFSLSFKEIVQNNISRPLKLLFTEAIILLITIYVAFVYGILYLCLTAYPLVFGVGYKMTGGIIYLPYVGLVVGEILACIWIAYCERYYIAQVDLNDGKPVPEARLYAMLPAGPIFAIGLLWFFWTGNYPEKVHWAAPAVAGIFIGFGLFAIFLPSLNYIVDSYLIYAASAMAANSFIRSIFGAVFPLFGSYMFNGMGINWAGLLLGLLAVVMIPVPFLFLKYGKKIRSKSKYAFDLQ